MSAASSGSVYWNVAADSSCPAVSSSWSEMTNASDVSFSSVMNSLPVGGITILTACGTVTFRRICRRVIPSARPASSWPGSTESRPARMISDMYAASLSESAIHAAANGENQLPANPLQSCGSAYQMKKQLQQSRRRPEQPVVDPRAASGPSAAALSADSATKNPSTIAVASATTVSSSAVSAPLQYGPEESACPEQVRVEAREHERPRSYCTSPTGSCTSSRASSAFPTR